MLFPQQNRPQEFKDLYLLESEVSPFNKPCKFVKEEQNKT